MPTYDSITIGAKDFCYGTLQSVYFIKNRAKHLFRAIGWKKWADGMVQPWNYSQGRDKIGSIRNKLSHQG